MGARAEDLQWLGRGKGALVAAAQSCCAESLADVETHTQVSKPVRARLKSAQDRLDVLTAARAEPLLSERQRLRVCFRRLRGSTGKSAKRGGAGVCCRAGAAP